jgi:hypothetical protein
MSKWIAEQREQQFRSELKKPSVWIEIAAMLLSEGDAQQGNPALVDDRSRMRVQPAVF